MVNLLYSQRPKTKSIYSRLEVINLSCCAGSFAIEMVQLFQFEILIEYRALSWRADVYE